MPIAPCAAPTLHLPICDLLSKAGPEKASQWLTVFSQIETEMAAPTT